VPKISTYPVVAPASNDLITVTDASDSNSTKNVEVGSLLATAYGGAYTEVYSLGGTTTTIAQASTWYPLSVTAVQGARNDNSLNLAVNGGEVSNQGLSRTFLVTYAVAGIAQTNNNLMFRLQKNGNVSPIAYSESDTICGSGNKSTSTGNFAIVTLNNGDNIRLYCSNASAAQSITLEHFNLLLRQI
jgi:hypothetical protein